MIYLDNAATTPLAPEVAETISQTLINTYGNPGSIHLLGREAKQLMNKSREIISASLGCRPTELYFTSGGSESDNWALEYGAKLMRPYGNHIISSAYEHPAIKQSLERLKSEGYEITELIPDSTGHITAENVKNALRDDTILISIMLVNNEVGTINDIKSISKAIKSFNNKIILHTDAVQGYMKIPFTVKSLGADMISICSHKIHGPKGIGALYINHSLKLDGLIVGGSQEFGKRAGTENVPYIVGFAKAVELAKPILKQSYQEVEELGNILKAEIQTALPDVIFYENESPYIISLTKPGIDNESAVLRLSSYGFCVSTASACKNGGKSQVLKALGKDDNYINGTIRISLSRYNTREEIHKFCDTFIKMYK